MGFRAAVEAAADSEDRVDPTDLVDLPGHLPWPDETVSVADLETLLDEHIGWRWNDGLVGLVQDVFDGVETIVSWGESNAWVDYAMGFDIISWGGDVYCYQWESGNETEPQYAVRQSHRRDDPSGRQIAFELAVEVSDLYVAYGQADVTLASDFPRDLVAALRGRAECPPWDGDLMADCVGDTDDETLEAWADEISSAEGVSPAAALRSLRAFRADGYRGAPTATDRTVAWWLYERTLVSGAD